MLDRQLKDQEFIAGDYSIADMACFPWIQTWRAQEIDLAAFPSVTDWYGRLKQREGLRRGMAVGRDQLGRNPSHDAEARRILFGIGEGSDGAR